MKLIETNHQTIYATKRYKCDICGFTGEWRNNFEWYGSYEDHDNGRILIVCKNCMLNILGKEETLLKDKYQNR